MAPQQATSVLKSFSLLSSPSSRLNPMMIFSRAMSRLFVGGLSFTTEEDGLRSAFSKFGEVIDAKVVKDRETGRSRGFGFITFMEEKEAEEALNKMSGQFLDGRVVRVDRAAARPPRPPPPNLSNSFDNTTTSTSTEPVAEDWGTIPSTMAPIPQNLGLYSSTPSTPPPPHDPSSSSGLPDLSTLASSSLPNTSTTSDGMPLPNPTSFNAAGSSSIGADSPPSSTFNFDPSPPTKASTKDTGPSFGFIDLDLSNLPPPDPNHVPRRRPPRIRPSSMGDYEFGYYMSETSKFPFNTNFETGIPRSSGPRFDFEFADIKEANAIKKAEWLAIKQAQEAEEAAKQAELEAIKKAKEAEEEAVKQAKAAEEEAIKLAKEAKEQASKPGNKGADGVVNEKVSGEHPVVSDADTGADIKNEGEGDKQPPENSVASQNATTLDSSQESQQPTKVELEEVKPEV